MQLQQDLEDTKLSLAEPGVDVAGACSEQREFAVALAGLPTATLSTKD